MDFKLVSFKLCPFVHRCAATLAVKNADYAVDYIDLATPPDWFLKLSPRKKVPILIVDGKEVLFESGPICEFIDEVTDRSFMPGDPLTRAKHRAWIEFGSDLLMDTLHFTVAKDAESFQAAIKSHADKLNALEEALGESRYFDGEELSLIDIAYTPLAIRVQKLKRLLPERTLPESPKVDRWWRTLAALPQAVETLPPDFDSLFQALIAKRNGYMAKLLGIGGDGEPGSARY